MGRPEKSTPTDWELNLLQILWDLGRVNVDDIREHLRSKGVKRSNSSLRTILRIMLVKGLVNAESINRTLFYTPAIKKPLMEKHYFRHLVKNLFRGNREVFALRVLDEAEVTEELVQKMKEKINQYKKS